MHHFKYLKIIDYQYCFRVNLRTTEEKKYYIQNLLLNWESIILLTNRFGSECFLLILKTQIYPQKIKADTFKDNQNGSILFCLLQSTKFKKKLVIIFSSKIMSVNLYLKSCLTTLNSTSWFNSKYINRRAILVQHTRGFKKNKKMTEESPLLEKKKRIFLYWVYFYS